MGPIQCLFEAEEMPRLGLPPVLATIYGGDFSLPRPRLYANFVASVDGIVALPAAGESGALLSGHSEPDRFVMGLLRALADAVLIGAGTFRAGGGDLWLPEAAFPAAAEPFANLRTRLGLRPRPLLVVVSASGNVDPAQPALRDCLVLTTSEGEKRLKGKLPEGAAIAVMGEQPTTCRAWLDLLYERGLQTILNEGGPTLFGQLLAENLINELFLTISPKLFGRVPSDGRKSLVASVDLQGRAMDLVSARRHESYLFLRYRLAQR
jgi:riboflavin biosynthesis pyrimidine reductase